jgi:hypothetical protein
MINSCRHDRYLERHQIRKQRQQFKKVCEKINWKLKLKRINEIKSIAIFLNRNYINPIVLIKISDFITIN